MIEESPPPPRWLLAPPESFLVFVVGHCEEWPENRDEQGDTAIYNEYLDFGVPVDQCVYIKDSDCTRINCEQTLTSFLQRMAPSSLPQRQPACPMETKVGHAHESRTPTTLVFYYGGHGSANGFCTIGGTWAYRRIVQTIEENFHGDRVLFLLDSCASGNLWQFLPSPSSSKKRQYTLLATSQPYIASSAEGEEWILSNTWIQLMRHLCDKGCHDSWGLERMISLMADRHIFGLGDLFFAYLTPPPPQPSRNDPCATDCSWSWMPSCCRHQQRHTKEQFSPSLPQSKEGLLPCDSRLWSENSCRMPNEAKILSIHDCRVGDAVAYKHPGGYPVSLAVSGKQEEKLPFFVPPLWLNGTIVSMSENNRDRNGATTESSDNNPVDILLRIRVWYPSQTRPWEVEVSHFGPRLINHFFVAQNWMLPRSFLETQVILAEKYQQYLDCSIPANTPVRVALGTTGDTDHDHDDDDDAKEGTILDWRDFKWKRLLHSCNGTSLATTEYDEFYWDELPVPVKTAAIAMGYTKSSWNNDTGIAADSIDWKELSRVQKDAATVLGYVQVKSVLSPSPESNGSDNLDSKHKKASTRKNISEISRYSGPHIPVKWNGDCRSSFVPLDRIIFPHTRRNCVSLNLRRNPNAKPESTSTTELQDGIHGVDNLQRQSLIRGLESSGKSIGNAKSIFGTSYLSAFWVEDESWYDATPIEIMCNDSNTSIINEELSLDLLATHFEYTLPGVYCPVVYEDGGRHLIPLNYIFKRGCQPQHGKDEDGGNETNTEDSTSIPSIPTDEAIDKITKNLLDISSKASSFGKNFSEAVRKLEEASKSIRASFESCKDDRSIGEQNERNPNTTSSNTTTSTFNAESLSHPTEQKSFLDDYWGDLPGHIKTVAKRIGYNKKLWDTDGRISIELKEWKDLTSNEKKDLEIIGYNETNWCQEDDSSYSTSSGGDY